MNRQILRLALPNILANISVPLISSVDTALMGHLSAAHLAALGIGGMIFMFLYSSFGFLRMGTTGMTAQAFGAGDGHTLSATLYRAMILALILALPMIIFENIIFGLAAEWMNVEASYRSLAQEYFSIRIWTAPAVLLMFVLTGFFFGMQNSRYPLYVTVLVNLVNVGLSIFLVRVLEWGIAGAAWGTVVAQYAGLAYAFWLLGRYRASIQRVRRRELLRWEALSRFFHVNRNIFIRTLALTFSLAFFYAQAAKGGEVTLSVMILLLQFLIWSSFAIDGFANAAESLVGRYYGAGDRRSFAAAVKYSLLWGGGLAILFSVSYGLWGGAILRIFTDSPPVLEAAERLLPLASLLPLLAFAAFIYDGIFIGMTAVKAMRNAVLSATAIYLGSYYLLKSFLPLEWALWISFLGFFFYRGVLQWWMFRRKGWELK
ncbi:MATE family efflux transporter [Nitratifractor salsuginis]|uniref:MATE efflux family protein n=1 Tax=Nitratifractor salsuginis (strain DSM 16511 / JCM 12458 / E9I37-1) TaxID=749222 RepID=E6WYF1_NITSE|nr:MATE family efflux transporter [Nitratifractor salsuginis]ADV46463.1 MATE efflux family protein [Nitratifractor salsuginis DSM 16511]